MDIGEIVVKLKADVEDFIERMKVAKNAIIDVIESTKELNNISNGSSSNGIGDWEFLKVLIPAAALLFTMVAAVLALGAAFSAAGLVAPEIVIPLAIIAAIILFIVGLFALLLLTISYIAYRLGLTKEPLDLIYQMLLQSLTPVIDIYTAFLWIYNKITSLKDPLEIFYKLLLLIYSITFPLSVVIAYIEDKISHIPDIIQTIPSKLEPVKEAFEKLDKIVTPIISGFKTNLQDVMSNAQSLIDKLSSIVGYLDKIKNNDMFGKFFSAASSMDVPFYAEGGIVSSPTIAVIGEAGPEAIIPLSKLGDMNTQYTNNSQNFEFNITVNNTNGDPSDIGKQVATEIQRALTRKGIILVR